MKRIILFPSVLFILLNSNLYAQPNTQLLFEENFNYEPGPLMEQSDSIWINYSNPDIRVIEYDLKYPKYNSDSGNCIYFEGVSYKGYSIRSIENAIKKDVYISFLLMAKNTLNMADYRVSFLCFANSSLNTKGNICIKKSIIAGNINIGVYKNTEPCVFSEKNLPVMKPVLVIMKYTFKPDSSDDLVSLWIDLPLNDKIEPVPDVQTGAGELDLTDFKSVFIKPNSYSGNLYIDGIRISTSWAQAPLPVELSSFTAKLDADKVVLDWKTETEVANYGFDIERKTSNEKDWKKIGFIEGHGNSNSPKFYSFSDKMSYGVSFCLYRLKQIDTDGTFTFSNELSVNTEIPSQFNLYQNYPNPFNPSTKIRFGLPEDCFISVKVYNTIGENIAVLLNKFLKAGNHEITFNGSGINSGIYFCVAESNGIKKVIKLILAK